MPRKTSLAAENRLRAISAKLKYHYTRGVAKICQVAHDVCCSSNCAKKSQILVSTCVSCKVLPSHNCSSGMRRKDMWQNVFFKLLRTTTSFYAKTCDNFVRSDSGRAENHVGDCVRLDVAPKGIFWCLPMCLIAMHVCDVKMRAVRHAAGDEALRFVRRYAASRADAPHVIHLRRKRHPPDYKA